LRHFVKEVTAAYRRVRGDDTQKKEVH
jgi:hypothetical protein